MRRRSVHVDIAERQASHGWNFARCLFRTGKVLVSLHIILVDDFCAKGLVSVPAVAILVVHKLGQKVD